MVTVNANRMWTVTDAKAKLNALVSDAQNGITTHIVSSAQVVANLVPATARIIDNEQVLHHMLLALTRQEVRWAAEPGNWPDGHLFNIGDYMGKTLGWIWHTDPGLFMTSLVEYVHLLGQEVGRDVSLDELRRAIHTGLRALLTESEVLDALSYAEKHWREMGGRP